jgi:hypothetical protein
MADQSMLAGLDLSSIPDAPKPKSLLSDLDLSSIPDAPKQPELSPDQVIPDFDEQSGYRPAPFKEPPTRPDLLREIAQRILFPNVAAGSPVVAPPPAEISTLRDRDASPCSALDSPEAGAIKNQPPYYTNTCTNNNADASVLESVDKKNQVTNAEWDAEGIPAEVSSWAMRAGRILENEHRPPVTHVYEDPNGTATYQTHQDKQDFEGPRGISWQGVYDAGKADGGDLTKVGLAVGHFGTFDFQRKVDEENKPYFFDQYVNASNYAVGVYMKGAGFSLNRTLAYAKIFAHATQASNADAGPSIWCVRGWNDADRGELPKEPEKTDIEFE